MARGRGIAHEAKEDIAIRTAPRKRKLVQYTEAESENEAPPVGDELNGEDSSGAETKPTANTKSSTSKPKTPKKPATTVQRSPRGKKAETVTVKEEAESVVAQPNGTVVEDHQQSTTTIKGKASASKGRKKVKAESTDVADAAGDLEEEESKPVKRKKKTKEEKEAEAMPLTTRTPNLKYFVGAHTSMAKGVENAIHNSAHIGGNAFACFLKSQRKWDNPPLKDENRDAFRAALITHKYDAESHIVPHGSYLVNLATEDKDMAKKSYDAFVDDLKRCEALGIKHYNFHPGAAGKASMDEAIGRLAHRLTEALSETTTVVPLLENMATRGSVIGGKFADLRAVIDQIKPEYKSRIGVCIDTCHAFASGYDLRTSEAFKKTLQELDDVVGFKYVKALHLNDSKAPFSSNKDLHQNIGVGFLGLRAFHSIMNEPRFQNLPLILETPCERPDPKDPTGKKTIDDKKVWVGEIKLLESLIGMDPDGSEFKKLEKDLSDQGKAERAKMQKSMDETAAKKAKKLAKEMEKGQQSLAGMFGGKKKDLSAESDGLSDASDMDGDDKE